MYCDFTDGLELVSATPTVNGGGRPAPHGPGLPDNETAPTHERKATFHGLHAGDVYRDPDVDPYSRPPSQPPAGWKGSWPIINNSIRHAGSWHNDFPGDVRVHPDPSGMVTFFDPALTSRLFKPFSRLHTDEEFAGTGVGLATVARIMQRHGGAITAHGALGQGATFQLSFAK